MCIRDRANTEDGAILSSDVAAIVPFTTQYFVVPEFHVVCLSGDGIEMYDLSGDKARIDWLTVDWDISRSDKGGYQMCIRDRLISTHPRK